MKKWKLIPLVSLFALFGLVSCGTKSNDDNPDNPPVVVTKYKITYVSDHGTKPADKTDVTSITEADLPTLTDDEYTFGGWYADANYTITVIAGKMTSDMTLYAKWTKKSTPAATYSITYVSAHGTKPTNKTGVTAITEADLPTLTDDDYTFGGWYTNEACTTRAQAGTLSANVTLYAKWTAKPVATYSITYVSDHGTKPSNKTGVTAITEADLPTLTDDDYTFGGWYTNSSLTTLAQTGALSANVTLYAKWTAKPVATYSITYVSAHGTKPSNKTNVTSITSADLPTLTDDDYTFGGWYTNEACTTRAQAGTLSANVTLYAKWTAKPVATYSITYVSDHGTAPATITNATEITSAMLATISADGYVFAGWYTNAARTTAATVGAITSDTTLYAKWTAVDSDTIIEDTVLQFKSNSNTSGISNVIAYDVKDGSEYNYITAGSKGGFTIAGSSFDNASHLSFKNGSTISFDFMAPSGYKAVLLISYYYDNIESTVKVGTNTITGVAGSSTANSYVYKYDLSTSGSALITAPNQQNYLNWIAVSFVDTSTTLTNLDVSYMKVGAGGNTSYNGTFVTTNAKTLYMVGESFNANGIYGVATYSNNTTDVLYGTSLTYSGFDSSTAGTKTVTVSYTYNGTTLSDTFNVYVTNVEPSVVNNVLQVRVSPNYPGAVGTVVSGYNVFKTIGQALDYLRTNSSAAVNKYMYINAGTYNEKLEIDIPNLTIAGEGASTTIIEYDSLYGIKESDGFSNVTDSTQTVAIREAANNCTIKNITISNKYNNIQAFSDTKAPSYVNEKGVTITYAGNGERGLALLVQADQFIMEDSRLLGWQDTLELFTGRQYFRNTYISGCIDYIFGTNSTTLFDGCEIHTVKSKTSYTDDSRVTAYITATKGINRTGTAVNYGLIFNDCEFTSDSNFVGKYAVARPWEANSAVAVLNSTFDDNLVATESGTIATGLISDVNVSTVKFKFYNNVYENNSAITLTNDLTNVDTTLTSSQAANYLDTSVICGTSNGGVTYTSAWNLTITERIIITLELNGGSGTPTSVTINKGSALAVVEPTKSGYEFEEWCYDQACTTPYNDELLNTATTLYAKWTESTQSDPVILLSSGYTEAIYATFTDSNPEYATVKYKATSSDNWLEVDEELIRPLTSTAARVDIVGLEEGKYDIQVITSQSKQEIKQNITVYPDDRSGYAHFDASTSDRKISTGIGAYNNNGTLKSNAEVIYVTDATKNTVTYGSYVGLVDIISHSKQISKPLDIRIIGTIKTAQWNQVTYTESAKSTALYNAQSAMLGGTNQAGQVTAETILNTLKTNSYSNDLAAGITVLDNLTSYAAGSLKNSGKSSEHYEWDSCWNMCNVSEGNNITIEGIGEDATIFQWGFSFAKCSSIEIKNLTFDDYTEDAVGFEGEKSNIDYGNFWIHNCTFEEGVNRWDLSYEKDKGDGDGSTDFKRAHNLTISYCRYNNTHKTNLIGSDDNVYQYNITLHHNYYDGCKSRLPLIRQANVHMYNNYYHGTTSVSSSIRANCNALAENNYYDMKNSVGKNPYMLVPNSSKVPDTTGTAIKAIGNIFDSSLTVNSNSKEGYYYKTNGIFYVDSTTTATTQTTSPSRNTQITTSVCTPDGSTDYSNFDTKRSLFYCNSAGDETEVDFMNDAADVPTIAETYYGAGKCNAITSEFGAFASIETYDVSYVSDHGTKPSNKTGVTAITEADLPKLTDDNYTFGGWYFDSSFNTPATTGKISSNKVLYAKWTEKSAFVLNATDMTTTTSDSGAGSNIVNESGVTISIVKAYKVAECNSGVKFSLDGNDFTKVILPNGGTTETNGYTITATQAATITIYYTMTNSSKYLTGEISGGSISFTNGITPTSNSVPAANTAGKVVITLAAGESTHLYSASNRISILAIDIA